MDVKGKCSVSMQEIVSIKNIVKQEILLPATSCEAYKVRKIYGTFTS
jgi:hypothetical protein